ncbi:MAG: CRISPR-associated helicase/endonuclease Cas3 [Bacteroidetes bacterium QS_7_67_15]|nr:MAG: CRISPR-associated helicase/endonuclease Cas3 [Bacteroidetes bacterium QS_7_67_15]
MNGSPDPSDFWAKLDQDDDGNVLNWHPLAAHSAEVAAVTEALLTRTILRDRLAALVEWDGLSDVHVQRLCVLAALHDAGKVNHGFQNRGHSQSAPPVGHVWPMIDVFNHDQPAELLEPLGVLPMVDWFADEEGYVDHWANMLMTAWAHHGRPVPKDNIDKRSLRYWKAEGDHVPEEGLKELGRLVRRWFPDAFDEAKPFPKRSELQHAFNGVLTLADWIASSERFFGYADDLSDPMPHARDRAREIVDDLTLDAGAARAVLNKKIGFDEIFPEPAWEPHPVQEAVRDLPLHAEGSLVVLESDTGSGKTEAALARFMRLFQAGQVDGMYFAVPTRTAAKQLYERVDRTAKRLFPNEDTRPSVVQAVPGYIKADDVEAERLPGYEVRWDEDLRHRGWAAEQPKRYLWGSIVVGTVDQVLLSTLQVDHAHLRAAALLRHFLVVDEVHASDVYMTQLLDNVIEHHLAADGHALLMSATLGSAARVRLTTGGSEDPPPPEEAEATDYPLVTHVDASRSDPQSEHAASGSAQKEVAVEARPIASDPAAVARLALENTREGARVLVIRNRVKDCIDTQRALEEAAGEDTDLLFAADDVRAPHHARFAPDDRRYLDAAIEETFGKETQARSVVAVATQTVEQSLDIDADLLVTDLCPIDVLLQRIGRLHRHRRADFPRPDGFGTARCLVVTPDGYDLGEAITGEGSGFKGPPPHGLGTVYDDLRALEATRQIIEGQEPAPWRIPEHNRLLVERATHPTRLRELAEARGGAWERHQSWVRGTRTADRQAAGYVEIDRSAPYPAEEFPTKDLMTVKTRLGRDDHRVLLPEEAKPVQGPFGAPVQELAVSEWQVDGVPETEEAEKVEPFEGGFTFVFSGKPFRYDRHGLALREEDS